ncbi:MAG: UTP--glucose-1-phosphate uridylyltransferase [Chloroflexi bacterium]|nr:UTP--glucose-1-phosphate uridylyltransferase [Chloroflexota bacterium]
MPQHIRTAVIPAAGLGTRFLPFTKAVPKELAPVIDRPAIHYVVKEAMDAGIQHIAIVTSPGKEALGEYFKPSPEIDRLMRGRGMEGVADELRQMGEALTFSYPVQAQQLGLGHAVLCAREAVGEEPFAVILPDDLLVGDEPVLAQMLRAWWANPGNYVAVEEVLRERISAYGVVDLAPGGQVDPRTYRLRGMVEKPPAEEAPSNLGVVGRYLLMPQVFDALARTRPGAIGEIQLTDGIARSMEQCPLYAYRYAARRYDCGTPLGLLAASLALALRREDTAAEVRGWLRGYT